MGGGGGGQVIKSAKNRKRGRVCIFQTTGNEQLFILTTITENYGWKWSLLLFWMSSSRKCSHTSKWLVETRTLHFAWLLNRRFCFEIITNSTGISCTVPRDVALIPSIYIWVGFRKTEHAQDQQSSVAYGQRNSLTRASSSFISFTHIFTKCNIL